ncbi:MAG: alpha/beta hydrolase [Actinomycetota bacterium]|nr:alpha/beta hydrolase [Actinomycetota bacterium]
MVPSTDGVELAVHDLGGAGAALLVSHATGFHGRCYQPLADQLATTRCIAFDYRGHGDTPRPAGELDWPRYGDDAEAMAQWLATREGGPIDAFGHSMGGACLLMAAHRRPELFRRIVAFEPIVFPPTVSPGAAEDSAMVQGARRRRSTFPSYAAAIANYSAKPPLNAFTPEALAAYVHHGFAPDGHGHVHLKCTTDTEATTFAGGPSHDTWRHLPAILTEVVVIAGRTEPMQPSAIAVQIAEQLPNGRYEQYDDLDHFGPMTHPREMAQIIADALER